MRNDPEGVYIGERKYATLFYKKGFELRLEGDEEYRENIIVAKEDKECCAKEIHNLNTGSVRHFVKLGQDGSFVDPYSNEFNRSRRTAYRWVKVIEPAFKLYTKYLRTGSRTNLYQAERER